MFKIVLGKKIRKLLLRILNKSKKEPNSLARLKKISSNSEEQLSATEYLKNKNFNNYTPYAGLFDDEISIKDVDDDDESILPNIKNKNNINSNSKIINSNGNSIKTSFNDLYKIIYESEYENKEEINRKVRELENELQKEEVNESQIHQLMEWLKENAEEIRDMSVKIVADALSGTKK
jgi:hypothetical protein